MVDEAAIIVELANYQAINPEILAQFNQYRDSDDIRRSHFFEGRYENLYLDLNKIPAMQQVMHTAVQHAQAILNTHMPLKYGFWFNLMLPGQVTLPHSHDDDDECLSGVYYVDIPENSGDLILTFKSATQRVVPQSGRFVFFPPEIRHEVTENKSSAARLSVGMNFGPA